MSKIRQISLAHWFLIFLAILSILGLFFVFEASIVKSISVYGHQYHFITRQLLWFVCGLVGFAIAYLLPLSVWQKIAPVFYFAALAALFLTLIPEIGLEVNAARRWINLGFTSFQPVEFFKLALVIYFASWLSQHQRTLPFIFLISVPAVVLLLQPDIGSLLVLLLISSGMFFVAGGELKKILPIVGVGLVLLTIAVLISPYRLRRIQTFLNPETDPLGASFQIRQITLALSSGGWFGVGLGNSRQNYAFIPELSSDSIFAIVAEELGFIGSSLIIICFGALFYCLYKIAILQKEQSFHQLLVVGILIWIAGQLILNLGSIVALVPLTGLPLPLFSYGGSSLVSVLIAAGFSFRLAQKPTG